MPLHHTKNLTCTGQPSKEILRGQLSQTPSCRQTHDEAIQCGSAHHLPPGCSVSPQLIPSAKTLSITPIQVASTLHLDVRTMQLHLFWTSRYNDPSAAILFFSSRLTSVKTFSLSFSPGGKTPSPGFLNCAAASVPFYAGIATPRPFRSPSFRSLCTVQTRYPGHFSIRWSLLLQSPG